MTKYVKNVKMHISPNIRSYSNLFTGVVQPMDKTFTSEDITLALVKYKLPGNGEWVLGYADNEELQD